MSGPPGRPNVSSSAAAAACLRDGERPPTPPGVRKHRSAAMQEPGTQGSHWASDTAARAAGMTHGVVAPPSAALESAAAALRIAPETDTAAWRQAQAEANYARNKVPLGAPVPHGYVMPAELASGAIPFGKLGSAGGLTAREAEKVGGARAALRPETEVGAPPPRMEPGYQPRAADADWARAALPRDARFGLPPAKGANDTAAAALAGVAPGDTGATSARLVSARAADMADRLAPPHRGGSGPPAGITPGANEGRAGDALKMDPELLAAAAAKDTQRVGVSAARAAMPPAPSERTFGVPSVRRDIPPPAVRGIADSRAFGDDAPIATLVAPTPNAAAAMAPPMTAAEMEGLLSAAGVPLPAGAFADIFAAAAAADGVPPAPGGAPKARLATFQKLRQQRGL